MPNQKALAHRLGFQPGSLEYETTALPTELSRLYWVSNHTGKSCLTFAKEELDQIYMALLRSLHERGGAAQLDVGSHLYEELGHLQEASAAGQRQSSLLGLLGLGVDVCTCKYPTKQPYENLTV